jgi:hypothetical protein
MLRFLHFKRAQLRKVKSQKSKAKSGKGFSIKCLAFSLKPSAALQRS